MKYIVLDPGSSDPAYGRLADAVIVETGDGEPPQSIRALIAAGVSTPADRPITRLRVSPDAAIRPEVIEALDAWAATGRPTGGFLYSVLTNNLRAAVATADTGNQAALVAIVTYVYNELPSLCWGSIEKVEAWADAHPYEGGSSR